MKSRFENVVMPNSLRQITVKHRHIGLESVLDRFYGKDIFRLKNTERCTDTKHMTQYYERLEDKVS